MADDTREFEVFVGDKKYKVEAANMAQAARDAQEFHQQQLNATRIQEGNAAPEWAKPFMAAGDLAMSASEAMGVPQVMDRIMGTDITSEAKSYANRAGLAGTAANLLTASRLPTAVPKIASVLGGGPMARGAINPVLSALEGGAVGGTQAALRDQPVGEGVGVGAAGGGIGGAVMGVLRPAVNKASKVIRGIDDTIPDVGGTVLPKNPTLAARVSVANNVAESKAQTGGPLAYQDNIRNAMEGILRKHSDKVSPEIRPLIQKVVSEDPATKLTRSLGDMASDKVALAASSIGGGFAHPAAAILAPAALAATGATLKRASVGGTRADVEDLRRAVTGTPKYQGVLSARRSNQLVKAGRQGLIEEHDE